MLGVVATLTAAAATVPLANFFVNLYSMLLRVSRGNVDDVRFQLQSRKLLVHSADQVHRASRRVFGEELPQSLQVCCCPLPIYICLEGCFGLKDAKNDALGSTFALHPIRLRADSNEILLYFFNLPATKF